MKFPPGQLSPGIYAQDNYPRIVLPWTITSHKTPPMTISPRFMLPGQLPLNNSAMDNYPLDSLHKIPPRTIAPE